MKLTFNTHRRYSENGQIIVATLHDDRVVTFFDHTRQIDGEFKLTGDRFDEEVVMMAYDRNIAESTQRSTKDARGCNALRSESMPKPVPLLPGSSIHDFFLHALCDAHPGRDVSITGHELIPARGYLIRFDVSAGTGWLPWSAFFKMVDQSGRLRLEHQMRLH